MEECEREDPRASDNLRMNPSIYDNKSAKIGNLTFTFWVLDSVNHLTHQLTTNTFQVSPVDNTQSNHH